METKLRTTTVRPTHSHEIDYRICGTDIQYVEIELDPEETVVAEAGAMVFMDSGVQMNPRLSDGSHKNSGILGGLVGIGKRLMTGESVFLTFFTNKTARKKRVAFSAPYPGMIIPLDMAQVGGSICCQRESFLCCAQGISVDVSFTKRINAGLFGGEGFILQKLQGDGMAFIHAGGSIAERMLAEGETIYVDTGNIVGFQSSVDFNIQMVRGIKSIFFGKEGFFLGSLTGPGKVWVQSMPYKKLINNITVMVMEEAQRATKKKR
ncbi:MAG: TIGR00266 family protein [Hyphomicrobiales bacterium]|nr:TIGR00266 family protein [Hyphomicrobiales bacterium]